MAILRYGADSSVVLDCADGVPPQECGGMRGQCLTDLPKAVTRALEEPIEYPPLGKATTPGDRIVLALDHGLPQTAQITTAVIRLLVQSGVEADGITLLRTQTEAKSGGDPRRLLDREIAERITLLTHDPADRKGLAYLAASDAGEPILVNRALHEADLVLPIGCLQRDSAAGYFGIQGMIYPAFSDQKVIARFRDPGALLENGGCRMRRTAEADHVAWLLGINFTIQLVPGSGDGIIHVLAGESDAVRRRGQALYRAAWYGPVARRAGLVVAAIEGDSRQQTWENLGRALGAALELVEDGGAIAVCCELASQPGPAIRSLAAARSRPAALRQIRRERPDDALPAALLAKALGQGKLYLMSRLDPALVEQLDAVPLLNGQELARLARQYRSCLLLANAAHAMVTVEDEASCST